MGKSAPNNVRWLRHVEGMHNERPKEIMDEGRGTHGSREGGETKNPMERGWRKRMPAGCVCVCVLSGWCVISMRNRNISLYFPHTCIVRT